MGLKSLFKKSKTTKPKKKINKKILKNRIHTYAFLGGTLLSGAYAGLNAWNMHTFDKHVIKHIEIAANVPSVTRSADDPNGLSMETSLITAQNNLKVSRLQNPAMIWKTSLTDIGTLDNILKKGIERTQQIGEFQRVFATGNVTPSTAPWIKQANDNLNMNTIRKYLDESDPTIQKIIPTLEELSSSEFGQRIGSEYEALNTVVSGGTRIQAKSLKEKHRSLLDTLDKAGGFRSIIRTQADDYKQTHAHIFVGYLMANMGYVEESIKEFKQAKTIMETYPDDHNLAILRNTPELQQSTINGLIDSSIRELESLNNDPSKFSTGWWKRLRYYNQSIGGQNNPSIQDMAESIQGRYFARLKLSAGLALAFFFLAGRSGKRLRNSKEYEVPYAKEY